eukprot:gb/GEZN01011923.1/.p1 GENE.gb/GEZN01011923.1/~~gb/GEZN01011923.1/.p1  ORF type:complete len:321 (-),score=23.17 gb/GEZN01011923.1/:120-1082(-)
MDYVALDGDYVALDGAPAPIISPLRAATGLAGAMLLFVLLTGQNLFQGASSAFDRERDLGRNRDSSKSKPSKKFNSKNPSTGRIGALQGGAPPRKTGRPRNGPPGPLQQLTPKQGYDKFKLIAVYKPFDVLSQFTKEHDSHRTLAEFGMPPNVYPIGRLDRDSEGLLLLSNEPKWNDLLLNPKHNHPRTYHAQVEGAVTEEALGALRKGGLDLGDFRTKQCQAIVIADPGHPPRNPPIRSRKTIPTSWLELTLTEGKNRQVRRMTAAVGFPTLRLIRVAIGALSLLDGSLVLEASQWKELSKVQQNLVRKLADGRIDGGL